MANGNVAGKKMSQYTPLANDEKEYFLGDGEGAVVTVGETSASSGKVNRLVKLSDIGGGGGSELPNMPGDADTKSYVLGIKNNKLEWVELDTTVELASDSGTFSVNYVTEDTQD